MALNRDEYWWIEESGRGLISHRGVNVGGRRQRFPKWSPWLYVKKSDAKKDCLPGERPVKVRLLKAEE